MQRDQSPAKAAAKFRVFAALTCIFGFGIGFGVAEGVARLYMPHWAPATGQVTRFWQYDPRLGWKHVPGIEGVFASHGFNTNVKINVNGFRDEEVGFERQLAKRRVLVLGDSFVWGFGVNGDDMITSRLEEILPNVEAINLGVSGYSTDQELLLYQDFGYRYDADFVVLIVAYNDLRGNLSQKEYVIYGKPAFEWAGDRLVLVNQPVERTPLIQRLLNQVVMRSYVLTAAARVVQGLSRPDLVAAEQKSPTDSYGAPVKQKSRSRFEDSPQLHMMISLITELRKSIHEKQGNIPLLVMFADGYNQNGVIAAERLREAGIDALLLDDFLTAEDPSTHVADLLHWNPAGNQIVAQVIADHVGELFTDAATVPEPEKN